MKTARLALLAWLLTLVASSAFAQGGATSSISGVVVDTDGGVIPGATVSAKNEATAGTSTAVSAGNGTFTIPSLNVGSYTVTVSLQGFKTAVLKGVAVNAGGPASVKAVLEVGGLAETVVVEAASALIQTQTSAVSTTLTTNQIANLPVASRNALDFIPFLPGIQTPATNRDSIVNGLPQSSINITVDGVSVQDNYLKSDDGFFARMSPRLDSVEEVTVTTAGNGVDASAQGSTQIRFTTRSGTNKYTGSAYNYFQSDKLNTNGYFNDVRDLPKGALKQNQPGIRVGGPISIPKVYDGRDKAFFFVNYEELRQPGTLTTNSNFLTPNAFNGIFQYQTATGVQSVNLYQLAAQQAALNPATAAAFTTTPDPTIFKLLQDINAATLSGGTVSPLAGNFVAQRYSFQQDTLSHNRYPTFRVDYNISQKHRLNMSYNFNRIIAKPDTTNTRQVTFPGFPQIGYQLSDRFTFQTSVRSTLASNLINEVRVGRSGGPSQFSPNMSADMWSGPVANQNGYFLTLSAAGIANPGPSAAVSAREGSTRFVEDTLSYLRGAHSVTMGMNFTQVNVWLLSQTRVPAVTFGAVTGDPVINSMFTAANFPGSSATNRSDAQNLYSVLTGRVSAINATGRLDASTGKYVYNGDSLQEGHMREFDLFAQDSWKLRPNLSVNYGLRYVIQAPFTALNGSYSTATVDDAWGISGNKPGCDPSAPTQSTCNLFNPSVQAGSVPNFKNLGDGSQAFDTDWNNIGASVGANWTPSIGIRFLKPVFGHQGETSFSGGWNRAYERHGMSDFTDVLGANPGLTTGANRNASNGNLGTVPLLLRNGNLGPPALCPSGSVSAACMQESPVYPIPTTTTGTLNIFDPSLQVPYSDTYTVGWQRQLGSKSAFEVRYVGSRNREQWTAYNYNEVNILDNGFFNEFKLAQANLYANIAAGRGTTFAYMGPGTGTSPLPITLAYFSGLPSSQAGDATKYSSANFANSNYFNSLSLYSPAPFTLAGTGTSSGLNGSATFRTNAVAAGLSRNFFYANPDTLGGANVTGNGGYSTFNSLQTQFRRRLSNGLSFDANYAFGKAWDSSRYSFRVDRVLTRNTGTPGDVTHALKGTFVYELPFGQGKRFASDSNAVMESLIGGWQISGTGRLQSGRLVDLGNVRVIGMSNDEVQKAFKLRKVAADQLYMWPDDIIQNTIRAYSRDLNGYTQGEPTGRYFAPANGPDCIETIPNGYGQCGVRSLVVTGPTFRQVDLSFIKQIKLVGTQNVQVRFDFLNAFNVQNFTPVSGIGSTASSGYQITAANPNIGSAYTRTVQFVLRYNF